jgi:serine/arginine repetitive matrix protein 2
MFDERVGYNYTNGRATPQYQHTPSNSTSSSSAGLPLAMSPTLNSSHSSLGSAGSSFHSWDEEDKSGGLNILEAYTPAASDWNGLANDVQVADDGMASPTSFTHLDLLESIAGLTKDDIANIHMKLVSAALAKRSTAAEAPRKRRPSTSMSVRTTGTEVDFLLEGSRGF